MSAMPINPAHIRRRLAVPLARGNMARGHTFALLASGWDAPALPSTAFDPAAASLVLGPIHSPPLKSFLLTRFEPGWSSTVPNLVPRGRSLQRHRASASMGLFLILYLGALVACGAAYAQTSEQPSVALPSKDRETAVAPNLVGKKDATEQIKERGRGWFRQCIQDWDAATHMTKAEWERTCRRVAIERTKFLIEQSK